MTFYIGNTNSLMITGLRNQISGDYINDASPQATVKDKEGVEVEGVTWPVTLEYVLGSNGDYRAILSSALEIVAGVCYVAEVTADVSGSTGFWKFHFIPLERRQ